MADFAGPLEWFPAVAGIIAFAFLIIGTGAVLKRRWAQRELDALRKKYRETEVTDPAYNAVRALYFSAVADSQRIAAAETSSDTVASGDGGGEGGD